MPARVTQVTRKKFYGRSAIAAALRTALGEMDAAIKEAERPDAPLVASLQKIQKAINDAVAADKVYEMERKNLTAHLAALKKDVDATLKEIMDVPVLVQERADAKAIRKHNKLFSKEVKNGKVS